MKKTYNSGKNHPKYIDLSNKKFGNLLAMNYILHKNKYGNERYEWKCRCDCGNICYMRTNYLTKKVRIDCGRCARIRNSKNQILPGNLSIIHRVYRNYKRNAKNKNIEFSLSLNEFQFLLQGNCEYCGSAPKIHRGELHDMRFGEFKRNGIDRVDSSKGYTKNNTVSCCDVCNRAKLDYSLSFFQEWVKKIYNHMYVEIRVNSQKSFDELQ